MRKNYEQATLQFFAFKDDVMMISGAGQLSFGSDNVVAWWDKEGNSYE